MNRLIYTTFEHQSFGIDDINQILKDETQNPINPNLDSTQKQNQTQDRVEKFFDSLIDFSQKEDNHLFIRHYKKRGVDFLKTKNYVGIIQTPYGTLEILPKCFETHSLEYPEKKTIAEEEQKKQRANLEEFFKPGIFEKQFCDSENTSKNLTDISSFVAHQDIKTSSQQFLLFCLKTLQKSPKSSQISSLNTQHMPLLDIFIQMFCYELLSVYKKGLRRDYVSTEDNRSYLKGKLIFNEQIRQNLAHKERFYTSSDEYITDIAPNRLIKSTLKFLKPKASSHTTLAFINQGLEIFEDISLSANLEKDFLSCTTSRHFAYYDPLLSWCRLFLKGNGFTAFSGKEQAYALLFPMEKLFESYVAYMLKRHNKNISTQSSKHCLIHSNNNQPKFKLKADLYIKTQDKIIIADTKWKILKEADDGKHGISQNDLYQLFAYAHYHQANEVWLIYPKPYSQQINQETQKEEGKVKDIIENLREWNAKGYSYQHEIFTQDLKIKEYKIRLKVFFAPLAFF